MSIPMANSVSRHFGFRKCFPKSLHETSGTRQGYPRLQNKINFLSQKKTKLKPGADGDVVKTQHRPHSILVRSWPLNTWNGSSARTRWEKGGFSHPSISYKTSVRDRGWEEKLAKCFLETAKPIVLPGNFATSHPPVWIHARCYALFSPEIIMKGRPFVFTLHSPSKA